MEGGRERGGEDNSKRSMYTREVLASVSPIVLGGGREGTWRPSCVGERGSVAPAIYGSLH